MTEVYVRGCRLRVKDCQLYAALLRSLADVYEFERSLDSGTPVASDCRLVAVDFEEFLHSRGAQHCRVEIADPAEWRRPEEVLIPKF